MKIVLFVLFLFFSNNLYSDNFGSYAVLAIDGLNVRSEPDKNGKIIKRLPFGEIVNRIDYGGTKLDTIDNICGEWYHVTHNIDTGYVFSPYVYHETAVNNVIKNNEVRMIKEGLSNYSIDYHPGLNWYGLYKDSVGFYLEKVRISIILSKVIGMKPFENLDCLDSYENVLLKTNKQKPSLFIFGMSNELKEGRLKNTYYSENMDYTSDIGFLYPEQKIIIGNFEQDYYIRAYEFIQTDNKCNIEKRYQLECYNYEFEGHPLGNNKVAINLSESLDLQGTGKQHSYYKTPKIYWVGDLNSDGLIDFIIHQHTMTDGGGVTWTNSLFMSKNESGKLKIVKVAEEIKGSCH